MLWFDSAANRRGQSKPGPGSVLRPGARSLCAAMSRSGSAVLRPSISPTRHAYCASANAASSLPSSSTPIEKSLQRSRARQLETPACHARRSTGTNCTSSPSRRMRKCDETRRSAISRKYGCASGSRRLVNRRSMASPPYSPGGRLIECTTSSVISVPGGRSSWLGDAMTRAGVSVIFDAQALHAVAQLPEGDAEELGGGGAVEAGLAERLDDSLALDVVEVIRQRPGFRSA